MDIFDMVKARPDRTDPDKTHWDPIGVVFKGDGDRMWGQIFAIGDINIFPRKKQSDSRSTDSGPFG